MTPVAEQLVLLLGGNEGDTCALLALARRLLAERVGRVMCVSSLYQTEPWGMQSAQMFVNQAVVLQTGLEPLQCLERLQVIEAQLGRQPHTAAYAPDGSRLYASRPIDIDIIFYGNRVVAEPLLAVPHPRMAQRRFVLQPLAEVVPNHRHPLLGLTVSELLEACTDPCTVALMTQK